MMLIQSPLSSFFFFNDTATTEIYTLSLHDALPIFGAAVPERAPPAGGGGRVTLVLESRHVTAIQRHGEADYPYEACGLIRSEEHTSELQSLAYLVCRLLLEKKKKRTHLSCVKHGYS